MAQIYNEQVNWKPVQEQAIAEPTRQDYLGTAFQNLGNAMEKFGEYKAQIDDAKAKAMLENTEKEAFANFEKAKDATGSYEQAYSGYINTMNAALGSLDKQTYNRLSRSNPGFMGAIELKGKEQQFKMQQEHAVQEVENLVPSYARDVVTGRISQEEGLQRVQSLIANLSDPQQNKILKNYNDMLDEARVRSYLRMSQFGEAKKALQESQLGLDKYESLLNTIDTVEQSVAKEKAANEEKMRNAAAEGKTKDKDELIANTKQYLDEALMRGVLSTDMIRDALINRQPIVLGQYSPDKTVVLGKSESGEDVVLGKDKSGKKVVLDLFMTDKNGNAVYTPTQIKDLLQYVNESGKTIESLKEYAAPGFYETPKETQANMLSDQMSATAAAIHESQNGDNSMLIQTSADFIRATDNGDYNQVDNTENFKKEQVLAKDTVEQMMPGIGQVGSIAYQDTSFFGNLKKEYTTGNLLIPGYAEAKSLYRWLGGWLNPERYKIGEVKRGDNAGIITIGGAGVSPEYDPLNVQRDWLGREKSPNANATAIERAILEDSKKQWAIESGTYGEYVLGVTDFFASVYDGDYTDVGIATGVSPELYRKSAFLILDNMKRNGTINAPLTYTDETKKVAAELFDAIISGANAKIPAKDEKEYAYKKDLYVSQFLNLLRDPNIEPSIEVKNALNKLNQHVIKERQQKTLSEHGYKTKKQ